jgi:small subunit ribosomal protein S17
MATSNKDKGKKPAGGGGIGRSVPAAKEIPKKAVAAAPAPQPQAAPVAPAAKPAAAPPPATPLAQAGLAEAVVAEPAEAHGFRRKLVGRVRSDKMNKTVTVEVIRNALDPVYKKYIRVRERYTAHDETNQYKVGDRVEIQEHRPISRNKRWLVTRLVARRVEE